MSPEDAIRAVAPASPSGPLKRRTFLHAGASVVGAALLGACSDGGEGPSSSGTGSGNSNASFRGRVRVWTVPEGPDDEAFQTRMFEQFMADNPDMDVDLQFFPPAQYGNAMQLAFTGGEDAPDVFRVGPGARLPEAYGKGWVASIEEFITDEFRGRFPDWAFDPGASPLYREGEAMAVPRPDPFVEAIRVLYCNADLLESAGFNEPPRTWSEFAEAAAKITGDGGGQAYGAAIVGNTPNHLILQDLAGPKAYRDHAFPPISLLAGAPAMSEPSMIDTIEFWQGMHRDQILTPGWEAWKAEQALQQMAGGRLGMYLFPLFHTFQLRALNPEFNLVLAPPPEPDGGRAGSVPQNDAAPFWMMSSNADNREAAWRVLDFFGSVEFQSAALQELRQMSIMPGAYEGVEVDPDVIRLREIADGLVSARPDPTIGNDDATSFYADLIAEAPKPLDTYFEAVTNDTDFAAAAADYDAQLQGVIDQVLPNYPGLTMDAFTFPEWDPLEDYA